MSAEQGEKEVTPKETKKLNAVPPLPADPISEWRKLSPKTRRFLVWFLGAVALPFLLQAWASVKVIFELPDRVGKIEEKLDDLGKTLAGVANELGKIKPQN